MSEIVPASSENRSEPSEGEIRREQLQLLLRNQGTVLLGNISAGSLLAFMHYQLSGHDRDAVILWIVLLWLVTGARYFWVRHHRQELNSRGTDDVPPIKGLVLGSLISGLVWSGGVLWLTDPTNLMVVVVSCFFLAGMTSAALATLATVLPAFFAYVLPLAPPFGIMLLMQKDIIYLGMGAGVLLYTALLSLVAVNYNKQIRDTARLGLLVRRMAETPDEPRFPSHR